MNKYIYPRPVSQYGRSHRDVTQQFARPLDTATVQPSRAAQQCVFGDMERWAIEYRSGGNEGWASSGFTRPNRNRLAVTNRAECSLLLYALPRSKRQEHSARFFLLVQPGHWHPKPGKRSCAKERTQASGQKCTELCACLDQCQ